MKYKVRIWSSLILLAMSFGMSGQWNEAHAFDLDNAYVEASYPLGFGGEGATSDGSTLWIVEGNTIRSYDISGGGLSPITSIAVRIGGYGLAWDGTGLWTTGNGYVKYDPATGSEVASFFSSVPTASLGGLTFDGQYLWKASRPEFNQMDIATGNVVDTISGFNLPGIEEGLTYDGQYLYAISYNNASDPRIWKIDPASGALMSDSFALPDGTYNGLAFDGQSLWAVGWSHRTLYKISSTAVIEVMLDIKPGSCPNSLNCNSKGVLPVAILGTAEFDVKEIDPATVRLAGVAPLRWDFEDVATPYEPFTGKQDCIIDCTEMGPDGYMDATLKFDTQEVIAALGEAVLDGACLVAQLTGNLRESFGGTEIVGEDVIRINCKGK